MANFHQLVEMIHVRMTQSVGKQYTLESPLKQTELDEERARMTQALLPARPSVYPSIWFAFAWMSLILQLLHYPSQTALLVPA